MMTREKYNTKGSALDCYYAAICCVEAFDEHVRNLSAALENSLKEFERTSGGVTCYECIYSRAPESGCMRMHDLSGMAGNDPNGYCKWGERPR